MRFAGLFATSVHRQAQSLVASRMSAGGRQIIVSLNDAETRSELLILPLRSYA